MPAGRADSLGGAFDLALAKAVPAIPEAQSLVYESKYDGYRVVGVVEHGRARLWSRNGTDLTLRASPSCRRPSPRRCRRLSCR